MIKAIICGTIAIDSIETPNKAKKNLLGGSASYASLAASHFVPVGILSIVGKDFPLQYRRKLVAHKIDLEGLHLGEKTFCWHGKYTGNMSQAVTLKTELNALEEFEPIVPKSYRRGEYLFLANVDPVIQLKVIRQMIRPKFIVLDTMNYWIENHLKNLLKVIKEVDLMVLNDAEAKSITKCESLVAAGRKILSLGPDWAIIKKGEHGALLFSKKSHFSAPAYPIEVCLDPTGAGDSFGGGLIGYLAKIGSTREIDIRRGIIYGSVIASYCTEKMGIEKVENLSFKQIKERYEHFKKIREF